MTHQTPAPLSAVDKTIAHVLAYRAKYRGFPAVVHVDTVDDGTVEINAPAGDIWQKRVRVNVSELTDKQIVTA